MKSILNIAFLLLLALTALSGGCTKASPTDSVAQTTSPTQTAWPTQGTRPLGILGLPTPLTITYEEKSVILLIAQGSWYQVEVVSFQWYAIIWADSSVVASVWAVDEQALAKGIPSYVNPNSLWYPGITVTHTEGGITYKKEVAVDYDSYRVVYSTGVFTPGGTPSPSK